MVFFTTFAQNLIILDFWVEKCVFLARFLSI
jgi:hypothetical protein